MSVICPDGGIDLIERPAGVGIDLHGVDEAVADRLNAGGGVRLIDAGGRIGRLGRTAGLLHRLHLAGQRQWTRQFDDSDGRWRIDRPHGGCGIVIGDLGRLLRRGAAGQRRC